MLKNKDSGNYFKTFYSRRILRIFPLYYTVLLIYFILSFSIPNITQILPALFDNSVPIWSFAAYCQNYLMIIKQSFGAGWLSITWSLAIEEQFYLILPMLIYFLNRKFLTITIILLIITATVLRYSSNNWFQYHLAFQCRMDSLFTGVLIAIIFMNESITILMRSKKILMHILFLIFLTLFILYSFGLIYVPYYLIYSLFNILFGLFIILSLLFKDSLIAKFLRIKMLRKLGVISYGIYLFHVITINIIYWYLEKIGINTYDNLLVSFVAIFAFIITILLALVSFYYFENKLIKFGHRYKY